MYKSLLLFFLFINCWNLSAQSDFNALTTTSFLNFEECNVGTIEFVDQFDTPKTGLKVANWEESFNVTNMEYLNSNFVEFDDDRFYVKISLADSNLPQISVNLRSYADEVDPIEEPENFEDQIDGLVLTRMEDENGSFYYISSALMLVADTDRSDDKLINIHGAESEFDGTDDQSTDITLFSPIMGFLFAKYNGVNNLAISQQINVCSEVIPEERVLKVKLNIISLINPMTGHGYVVPEDIITFINNLTQRTYNQACILFVNSNGDPLTVDDVLEREVPSEIDMVTGVQESIAEEDENGNMIRRISPDQELIMDNLKDEDPLTIDLFFIEKFKDEIGNYLHQVDGESFNDLVVIPEANNDNHARSCFIAVLPVFTYRTFFSIPHEIGHVLTNNGHYGTSYSTSASEENKKRNLMKAFGTTQNNTLLYSSKRLTDFQITSIRTSTNIPSI